MINLLSRLLASLVLLTLTHGLAVSHTTTSLMVRDNTPLWDIDGAIGTMYYDLTGRDICAKQWGPDWSKDINTGVPRCGQVPLGDPLINTNRIVALNWTVMKTDMEAFCGKEVEVYHKGKKFEFSEGPFVLWDTCERCMCEKTLDLSSLAYAELTGQPDCSADLSDLRIVVTNRQIWAPDLITTGSRTTWTKTKKTEPIPLKVTNAAPVFPCRTPGDICRGAVRGMPTPDVRQVGEYCFEAPDIEKGGEQILRKDLFATQGVVPSGPVPSVPPIPARPTAPAPVAPSGSASAAKLTVLDPGLGVCTTYGKYGCVGNRPAICDVSGSGSGHKWVTTGPACAKCIEEPNGSVRCG